MPAHTVGTRQEWLTARLKLLKAEKELTRRNDELTRQRMELPWVPIDKLVAYKQRMGWSFPWVSSFGSDFNFDFDVSFTPEGIAQGVQYNFRPLDAAQFDPRMLPDEGHGLSAFALDGGVVYHTYSAYARGTEPQWSIWQWLDRAPLGRNEGDMSWFHRHDEYPKEGSA